MSLKFPKIRNINFQLSALFSAIFIVCSFILFFSSYFLLSSALKDEDYTAMQMKLIELGAKYQSGGIQQLREELAIERSLGMRTLSFVRVADNRNETLFILRPEDWSIPDIDKIENASLNRDGRLFRIEVGKTKEIIEFVSQSLSDGNVLQVGMNVDHRERVLHKFLEIVVVITIPLVFVSFIGGMLLSNRLLGPINKLSLTVQSIIETGDIKTRIPSTGTGDELDKVIILFNTMLERIGTLINGMHDTLDNVAHDLRTPMTRLRGVAEEALRYSKDQKRCSKALVTCIEESEYIIKMLKTLMDISEAEAGVLSMRKAIVNITPFIEEVADLYRYYAEEKGIAIMTELPDVLLVYIDSSLFKQIIANLLDNAIKYTQRNGVVTVIAGKIIDYAYITVQDNGMGIESDELPHIWQKLYRGSKARPSPGMGLGLSYVKAIVKAYGGTVDVESDLNAGSKFTVSLPLTE